MYRSYRETLTLPLRERWRRAARRVERGGQMRTGSPGRVEGLLKRVDSDLGAPEGEIKTITTQHLTSVRFKEKQRTIPEELNSL